MALENMLAINAQPWRAMSTYPLETDDDWMHSLASGGRNDQMMWGITHNESGSIQEYINLRINNLSIRVYLSLVINEHVYRIHGVWSYSGVISIYLNAGEYYSVITVVKGWAPSVEATSMRHLSSSGGMLIQPLMHAICEQAIPVIKTLNNYAP